MQGSPKENICEFKTLVGLSAPASAIDNYFSLLSNLGLCILPLRIERLSDYLRALTHTCILGVWNSSAELLKVLNRPYWSRVCVLKAGEEHLPCHRATSDITW